MKKAILFFMLSIISFSLSGCNSSKQDIKELEVKYKELERKYKELEVKHKELVKKTIIKSLDNPLALYFNDNGKYPKNLDSLKPTYLKKIPIDPSTNKPFFYRVLKRKGGEGAGYILGAKMENPENCNINAYSEQDLEKLIKENESEATKIEKLLKNNGNLKKGCYFVILY